VRYSECGGLRAPILWGRVSSSVSEIVDPRNHNAPARRHAQQPFEALVDLGSFRTLQRESANRSPNPILRVHVFELKAGRDSWGHVGDLECEMTIVGERAVDGESLKLA